MRRPIIALLVAAAVVTTSTPAARAQRPSVVPALASWTDTPGTFTLRRGARVVVSRRDRALLAAEARTLASDLGLRVATKARTGDIRLSRARGDTGLGTEGYRLSIGRVFTITAPTRAGAFYGGRTAVALLAKDRSAPRGRARDVPEMPERGMMLDVARLYFPPAWIAARMREMAALKLNLLHLHLSDNEAFRLPSLRHPEITSAQFYTRAEIRSLLSLARRLHITVVPEIDMPGHVTAMLAKHPEFQLTDISGAKSADKLDVGNPAARRFAADIVDEFTDLFGGPFWHMGSDEYLGIVSTDANYALYPSLTSGHAAVMRFVNEIGAVVRGKGRRLRVWSDGIGGATSSLPPGTVVEWWENLHSPSPAQLSAAGHDVLNAGWWPTYWLSGGALEFLRTPIEQFYEDWSPEQFEGPYTARWAGPTLLTQTLPRDDPHLLGATLNVWNDLPHHLSLPEIAAGIAPRLAVIAQRTWGSPDPPGGYAGFAGT